MASKLAVVAVGGNALIADKKHTSSYDQYKVVCQTSEFIADIIESGWRVILTHGNGPQVGFAMRRSDLSSAEVPPLPLDYAVADTQGAIGYMFQKALTNALARRKIEKSVATVITQTLVSLTDPAFDNPSKPIGSFMDEATARERRESLGWSIMEDSGRGWRRSVPSPQPLAIRELKIIEALLKEDKLVIACGGGGIPVAWNAGGELVGVEAVIDKDLASALLAKELKADLLLIPTGVRQVAVNFGKSDEIWLSELSLEEAGAYYDKGEFGAGSMGPKIRAVMDFVASVPGARGLITSPEAIKDALAGKTGTWIVTKTKSCSSPVERSCSEHDRTGHDSRHAGEQDFSKSGARGRKNAKVAAAT